MRTERSPFVSIIIPIRNEADYIERTLGAALEQDYPSDRMEVLVVDGMSDDGTREIIGNIKAKNTKLPVRIIDNPQGIVPTALNIGLKEAEGDVIARVDGHCLISSDYISKAVETLTRTEADCVGGRMTPVGVGWMGETIALAHNLPFGLGGGSFHCAEYETEADTVYMGIFRRSIFGKVGFFNEKLRRNQDIELNGRIRNSGGRIILSPEIRSVYFCRNTVSELWKQNYANGLWIFPTNAINPTALSIRHHIPLLFVLSLIVGVITSFILPYGWLLPASIAGVYILASLVFSLLASLNHGGRYFISLPVVFAVLHISYGIGTLVGLIREACNRFGSPSFSVDR